MATDDKQTNVIFIVQVVHQAGTVHSVDLHVTAVTNPNLDAIRLLANVSVPWDGLESIVRRSVLKIGSDSTAPTNVRVRLGLFAILHPDNVTAHLDCTAHTVISVSTQLIDRIFEKF
jgi:hypothetical protein